MAHCIDKDEQMNGEKLAAEVERCTMMLGPVVETARGLGFSKEVIVMALMNSAAHGQMVIALLDCQEKKVDVDEKMLGSIQLSFAAAAGTMMSLAQAEIMEALSE